MGTGPGDDLAGIDLPVGARDPVARWHARWPGAAGSRVRVVTRFRRSANMQVGSQLRGLRPGAAVETAALVAGQPPVVPDDQPPVNLQVVVAQVEGMLGLRDDVGGVPGGVTAPAAGQAAFHVTVDVEVHFGDRVDVYAGLELGAEHPRYILKVLHATDPADETCLVWLDDAAAAAAPSAASTPTAAALLAALISPGDRGVQLVGGSDGAELTPAALEGQGGDPGTSPATGLAALAEVDDIALVAMPDSTSFQDPERVREAVDALIAHCEQDGYRFALIDPPEKSTIGEVEAFRSQFDSTFAALHYPWLRVSDPTGQPDPGSPPAMLDVPPSSAVAGLYDRSDRERGVHQAPVDEVLHGITGLVTQPTPGEQEALNLEGVNTLRFIEGRGGVLGGARTTSSDLEWTYVNVRRLLIYLEHSIDRSTRWAVFEPNDERLWKTIRRTIDYFLTSLWRAGALKGSTAEEAFFVHCDRTTMTQSDLDHGRLVCEVGVAPTRPAEFVIFRIGQWTADATVD